MYLRRRERHEPFRKYRIAVCDTFYMYSGRYSMMNYRVPTKRAYGYFAAVTAVCLAFNSYITIHYGSTVL